MGLKRGMGVRRGEYAHVKISDMKERVGHHPALSMEFRSSRSVKDILDRLKEMGIDITELHRWNVAVYIRDEKTGDCKRGFWYWEGTWRKNHQYDG